MTDRPVLPPGAAGRIRERVFPPVDPYRDDPAGWVQDRAGGSPWSKQREILEAVRDHPLVAVPSCHSSGKSWTAAHLVAHWVSTREDALAVMTGPTATQVENIAFRELGGVVQRAKLPARVTGGAVPAMRDRSGVLLAVGRKPADLNNPAAAMAAFQGLHARYLLGVIDEAAGVEPWIFEAMETLATTADSRILAIGNPTDPASHFAKVCAPGSGWHVIRLSAFDTPAFTGERVPSDVAGRLVHRGWVEDKRRSWGESSPAYISRILAQFPEASEDALIPAAAIERARGLELGEERSGRPTRFGVDVARSGNDETVVLAVRDGRARVVHSARGHDLMRTTGEVVRLVEAEPVAAEEHTVAVDAVGLGAGVFDRLRELGAPVVAFNSAERAFDPLRFANRRAEAFYTLREALIAGELDLDPDDDDLAAQLGALRYTLTSSGKVQIERKEEMRRRGLGSPDRADALAMAVAPLGGGAAAVGLAGSRSRSLEDRLAQRRHAAERRIDVLSAEINRMATAEVAGRLAPGDALRRPRLLDELAAVRREIAAIDEQLAFEQDFGAADGRGSELAPIGAFLRESRSW